VIPYLSSPVERSYFNMATLLEKLTAEGGGESVRKFDSQIPPSACALLLRLIVQAS
jgi:hypothetical protein